MMSVRVQEIYCDASTVKIPDKVSLFYKSSVHHDPAKKRVHVDFTLQIRGVPVDYWGYWRCRISFWLHEKVNVLNKEAEFEYYKNGLRLALAEAEIFIQSKYNIKSILNHPSDAELWEKYNRMLTKE